MRVCTCIYVFFPGKSGGKHVPQTEPFGAQRFLGQRRKTERLHPRPPEQDRRVSAHPQADQRGAGHRVEVPLLPDQPEEGAFQVPQVRQVDAGQRGARGVEHDGHLGADGHRGRAGAAQFQFYARGGASLRHQQIEQGAGRGYHPVFAAAGAGVEVRELRVHQAR